MKNLLVFLTLIIFLQANACPQTIKSAPGLPDTGLYYLIHEEQLSPLHPNGLTGEELYKRFHNVIAGKLSKTKGSFKSYDNIFMPGDVVIDSTQRYIYSSDEKGRRTAELFSQMKDGAWENVYRMTYTYENAYPAGFLYEEWKGGAWVNSQRMTETYENSYRKRVSVSETWENGTWVPNSRHTVTFDDKGNELSYLFEQMKNGAWTNVARSSNTYDSRGNLLTYFSEQWENGAWVNEGRAAFTYNEQGKMLTYIGESWINGVWTNIIRITIGYDANGNELTYLWEDGKNGAWVNYSRFTSSYDSNGRKLTQLIENWLNGTWINILRITNTYSDNEGTIASLTEVWKNGVWADSARSTSVFNSNGGLVTFLSEAFISYSWVNDKKVNYIYDYFGNAGSGESFVWSNGAWKHSTSSLEFSYNSGRDFVTYYGSVVWVSYYVILDEGPSVPQEISLLQNFPNPFNSSTNIFYTIRKSALIRISVYDILGNRVAVILDEFRNAGFHQIQFDGGKFPSGVYIYRLESGGFTTSKKFILMK